MNDPYRGGTHLNDVTIIYPVFEDGELVFFPAVREHWADVGGAVPGSMSGTATEIYQEGMRIPPVKIVERGEINKPLMEVLLSNMRVREERLGDFNSSLAACRTAERRLRELTARYSMQVLLDCVGLNLARSEARMRANIAALPDGEYYYEDYLETFSSQGFEPLLLPLNLTINGEEMTADLTGALPRFPPRLTRRSRSRPPRLHRAQVDARSRPRAQPRIFQTGHGGGTRTHDRQCRPSGARRLPRRNSQTRHRDDAGRSFPACPELVSADITARRSTT